jgi:hypothetical protein
MKKFNSFFKRHKFGFDMNLSFILYEDRPAALLLSLKFVNISKERAQHAMRGLIRKDYVMFSGKKRKGQIITTRNNINYTGKYLTNIDVQCIKYHFS